VRGAEEGADQGTLHVADLHSPDIVSVMVCMPSNGEQVVVAGPCRGLHGRYSVASTRVSGSALLRNMQINRKFLLSVDLR